MTETDLPSDGEEVTTLQALIQSRRDERGWTYADLARRSRGELTEGRWQQLGSGVRQRRFPDPDNIPAMAEALEVSVTAVVLAAAASVGLPVQRSGPALAHLLPSGVDRLSERMQDALLAMIRAAVEDTFEEERDASNTPSGPSTLDRPPEGRTGERGRGYAARRRPPQS